MKRIFVLVATTILFYSGCNKEVEHLPILAPMPSAPTPLPVNYLIANAGMDTIICMPYGGTGDLFKGILDGRASRDDSGKIVSYSWFQIMGSPPNSSLLFAGNNNSDSGTIYSRDPAVVAFRSLSEGENKFRLKVRDDHGRVDSSEFTINVIVNFDAEYEGLSWDSAAGGLKTISVKFKPGLIETWPDFTLFDNIRSGVYLSNFNLGCMDTTNMEKLPYVPYDSIRVTGKPVFYTLISILPGIVEKGSLYPEIFAKANSGIDFKQKVSLGFIERYPLNSEWKMSQKKPLRRIGPD